jgi:hypothetical protein
MQQMKEVVVELEAVVLPDGSWVLSALPGRSIWISIKRRQQPCAAGNSDPAG